VYFEDEKYKYRFQEIPKLLNTEVWDYHEAKMKSSELYREELLTRIGVTIRPPQKIQNISKTVEIEEDDLPF